jgi:poly(A) polymerase
VRFADARADALRRDFTVNGMFQDPLTGEVIDYVGGRKDLAAGLIRAIGDPRERFGEDYLRMLRAVRFACRLDFGLARSTASSIRDHADRITLISGERIHDEVIKMLGHASAARAAGMMHDLHLLRAILPELFAEPHLWPAAQGRIDAVGRRGDPILSAGAMLCDLPAAQIRAIVRRWGGSNAERSSLVWLAGHVGRWRDLAAGPLARLKPVLAHPDFERLAVLSRLAEQTDTGGDHSWRIIRRRAGRIEPGQIQPEPFVTGQDLMDMGLSEGPAIGKVLRRVYEAQLNEAIPTRSDALRMARELVREQR